MGRNPDAQQRSVAGAEAALRGDSGKAPEAGSWKPLEPPRNSGTGNHFIEVCLDEAETVWFMLHSGSRGVGNRMGSYFIEVARKDMEKFFIHLPDRDLGYFSEGTEHFDDYVEAVEWAQDFARTNRDLMMEQVVNAVRGSGEVRPFSATVKAINCHHNYVARERHFGQNILVTRKGAVRAREGDMGIIPGSMGARSYIVRGKGNL